MLDGTRPEERDACFMVLHSDKNAELFLIKEDPYECIPDLPEGAELFQVQVPVRWNDRHPLSAFASLIARDYCEYFHWGQVSKKLKLWRIQRAVVGKNGEWYKV